MRFTGVFVAAAIAVLPATAAAQKGDLTHEHPALPNATVDFGVLPLAPIGGSPCLQSGGIGGPADPCSYKLHHLTPEETTVVKGGQVTFQIHGGGHGFAIYEVSKNTTREDIGQYLCEGPDPTGIADPALHRCNLLASNADRAHEIKDGRGNVVIAVGPNVTAVHPDNRVWSEAGRLSSAGAIQFLNGGSAAQGGAASGQLLTFRFLKTGRYLVICMNRVHFLNDWMFGFVNVTGE